ncbi:MAG TPA: UrcA family protein [Steroidobacteraceae bacterium]|jgi:UrcA family protein|nr:UrcA family protein [Steroidobacteraceae bacterium]
MNPSNSSGGFRGLVVAGIFVFLVPSPSVVSAADPSSASRTVKFADLNVSSSSGAHALYMRILAAAQAVCSYYPFATDGDKARCVRNAIADAVTKIDQPELSAVYNSNNKVQVPINLVSRGR